MQTWTHCPRKGHGSYFVFDKRYEISVDYSWLHRGFVVSARQCSKRGGELLLHLLHNHRVEIAGQTSIVMKGTLTVWKSRKPPVPPNIRSDQKPSYKKTFWLLSIWSTASPNCFIIFRVCSIWQLCDCRNLNQRMKLEFLGLFVGILKYRNLSFSCKKEWRVGCVCLCVLFLLARPRI